MKRETLKQQSKLLEGEQIVAAPTLVKKLPLPLRKPLGDMSDSERVLVGLDLRPVPHTAVEPPRDEPAGEDRS